MYIDCTNQDSVRLTGRWAVINTGWDYKDNATAICTSPGAIIDIAFKGDYAILYFDTVFNVQPYPHLWISVDGGARIEATVSDYIRINCKSNEAHTAQIIFKSSSEEYSRWHRRLIGKVGFRGFEAESMDSLPEDNRKVIEFLGDSITEGILADEDYRMNFSGDEFDYSIIRNKYKNRQLDQENRVYQDDAAASYAFLTAEKLNLRPRIMAYGGIGVSRPANGGVPMAPDSYLYYFDGQPIDYAPADYIVINYGTNDRHTRNNELVLYEYTKLLDTVRNYNPDSQIIIVPPFCGAFRKEFYELTEEYNKKNSTSIIYIDCCDVIPIEPIHPSRSSHKIIADFLAEKLSKIITN